MIRKQSRFLAVFLCFVMGLAAIIMVIKTGNNTTVFAESTILSNAADGDHTQLQSVLKAVNGQANIEGNENLEKTSIVIENEGADGKAFKFKTHSWGALVAENAIAFNTKVKISDITALTIRLYAHLSPNKNAYYTDLGGIRLYPIDSTGKVSEGYMIPKDIQQDAWVDLKLTGEDLNAMADKNGEISGFAIGSIMRISPDLGNGDQLYMGTPGQATSGYILFDSFAYETDTTFRVVFNSQGGTPVATQEVKKNEQANQPDVPVRDGYEFQGWYLGTEKYDFTTPVTGDITLNAKWKSLKGILSDGSYGDYSEADSLLKAVNGSDNIGDNDSIQSTKINTIDNDGAEDGKVFEYRTHSWAIQVAENAIVFDNKVHADDIDVLMIRVFAHLSTGSTYATSYGGIRLYPIDADGSSAGYMIPANIVQDEWTVLVLTKEELSAIADKDGYISGFSIGSGFRRSADDGNDALYEGTPQQNGGYILFDYFAGAQEKTVTYRSEGQTVQTQTVYTGTTLQNFYVPQREGFVFSGWLNEENEPYDVTSVIYDNLTLTAKWEAAVDLNEKQGYYLSGTGKYITVLDGKVEFSFDVPEIISVGMTENNLLVVVTAEGVQNYDLQSEYLLTESVVVTFDANNGDIYRKLFKKGELAEEIEVYRNGYIFVEWRDVEGNKFDFNTPITADLNLYAAWDYDEQDNYDWYYGTYYNREDNTFIVLKENNKADVIADGQTQEHNYYLLTSDELVIETSEGNMVATLYITKFVYNGKDYGKMGSYTVTFDSDGGSEIAPVTVAGNGWEVDKPQDPVKEGYTFKGWYLSDGSEFDFNEVLTESVTLYAKWAPAENNVSDAGGCQGNINAANGITGVLVLVSFTVCIAAFKKKRG